MSKIFEKGKFGGNDFSVWLDDVLNLIKLDIKRNNSSRPYRMDRDIFCWFINCYWDRITPEQMVEKWYKRI